MTYDDFFEYFKQAKNLLKTFTLEDPDTVKEFCTVLFKTMRIQFYMVNQMSTKDGYMISIMGSSSEKVQPVNSVDDILNFHLQRPLNYLSGALEEPWPPHCPTSTFKVDKLEAWLDYFQMQCSHNAYLSQFQEEIISLSEKAKQGEDIKVKLVTIVATIQKHNRKHLAYFIEICYQLVCDEMSTYV